VAIEAVAISSICGLIVWRVLRRGEPEAWLLRAGPIVAGALSIAILIGLATGPLRFRPKPWNEATFQDSLSGKILNDMGVTRGIVSMAGTGDGSQNVLVRADLLGDADLALVDLLPDGIFAEWRDVHRDRY